MNGFFSAVSGGVAKEHWLDQVANNLANVNTTGFKGSRPTFESHFVNDDMTVNPASKGGEASSSVVLVKTHDGIDFSDGSFRNTGNLLDLAIEGEGFFKVETPAGVRYTRNGSFHVSSDGILTTNQGLAVLGSDGIMTINSRDVQISPKGDVFVDGEGVGKLAIVTASDTKSFQKEGNSLYRIADGGEEIEAQDANISQGMLEMSNVKVISEMTKLINISRAYESYQKAIQSMNDMHTKVINDVGRAF